MQFGEIPVSEAEGAILAHRVRAEGRAFTKGHRISSADIEVLRRDGHLTVTVGRPDPEDVDENTAAARIAQVCAGRNVRVSAGFAGRANLYAEAAGVLCIDAARIAALNGLDESITLATLAPFARVAARQMLATVKIIPFAVPKSAIDAAERLLGETSPIGVAPFRSKSVGLVSTTLAHTNPALLDKNRQAIEARVSSLGSRIAFDRRIAHRSDDVAAALLEARAAHCDPVLIFGAGAITDRRDVVPMGIARAGGAIVHFGMPVDPGNLLLLGRLGEATIIGLPGCARSLKRNGLDFVLERVLADIRVQSDDISAMGVGGLLSEIASRPQPRESEPAPAPVAPRIAAVILAAGLSSRMGRNKLLIELDGQPLIRRVATAVMASQARPLVVVTGHDRDNIARALSGVPASLVHNPDFGAGLSTSLHAGIDAVPATCDGALILLGDMPGISARLIDTMMAAFAPDDGRAICVAVHNRKRGNPVLWARRFFPSLRAVTGDIGAKHVIVDNEEAVCEVDAQDDGPLTDIDTPDALASFLARHP